MHKILLAFITDYDYSPPKSSKVTVQEMQVAMEGKEEREEESQSYWSRGILSK